VSNLVDIEVIEKPLVSMQNVNKLCDIRYDEMYEKSTEYVSKHDKSMRYGDREMWEAVRCVRTFGK
jgi:hypothetical protein